MRQSFHYVLLGLIARSVFISAQLGDNIITGSLSAGSGITIPAPLQTTSASSSVLLLSPTWGNGTCVSRTANYITHTLPQQCLRTDRAAANAGQTTGANETTRSRSESQIASSSEASPTHDAASTIISDPSDRTTASSDADRESDSPLDNSNFLSFEEWKRQNQAKLEQISEHGTASFAGDRQRPGINNALDSLGEEGEIELDFSGFGTGAGSPRQQQAAYRTAHDAASGDTKPTSNAPRSKDAGKTCKERTNYASFDCAAAVLKNNPECKSAQSVLVENKDSYMLNTCSANNKFFIVELCNDILIDTVVLANYEFFSSIFRQFRVSVSDRYPVKLDKWRDLGTFEARNTREVQAFLIEHPQIWARYLRIEFLSHYGSEYYCPVSLLRVHGTTMLEEIRPQEEISQAENAEEPVTLEAEATAIPPISQEPASSSNEASKATLQAMPSVEEVPKETTYVEGDLTETNLSPSHITTSDGESAGFTSLTWTVNVTGILTSVVIPVPTDMTCASNMTFPSSDISSEAQIPTGSVDGTQQTEKAEATEATPTASSKKSTERKDVIPASQDMGGTETVASMHRASDILTRTEIANTISTTSSAQATSASFTNATGTDTVRSDPASPTHSSSTNTTRSTPATASTAAQAQPSTQESFFKSIHKRLQQLEANSTLSLQYIEEQSRILRDAFSKVEKRQISATTSFLSNLNQTVMAELQGFRQAYDQLWQSTVIELEGQREQYQREMLALSSRLTLVADELVWQKRMGIVQSTLLLLCLGLVLFARTGQAGYLEVPLLQQMRNKSYTALSGRAAAQGWESPGGSPSPESRTPVGLLKRKLLWRSYTDPSFGTESRPESKDGPPSSVDADAEVHVKLEAPTPESEAAGIFTPETDYEDGDDGFVEDTRETHSSPPTPTGERERKRDEETVDWVGGSVGVT